MKEVENLEEEQRRLDIKKCLYKQKPYAHLVEVRKDGMVYHTDINMGTIDTPIVQRIKFLVPLSEIGETIFTSTMHGQLFIRYII